MPPLTGSDLIALGALLVAGLSLLVTYRERTAEYRLRVYGEQVTALSEIAHALAIHFDKASWEFMVVTADTFKRRPLTESERGRIRANTSSEYNALGSAELRKSFLIPELAARALAEYRATFMALTEKPTPDIPTDLREHLDPRQPFAAAYARVLSAFRDSLKVDRLSGESFRLLGDRKARPLAYGDEPGNYSLRTVDEATLDKLLGTQPDAEAPAEGMDRSRGTT